MSDVSKLKFSNNREYNIKDSQARNEINELDQKIDDEVNVLNQKIESNTQQLENEIINLDTQLEENTQRINDLVVNVKKFGAQGDGVTDDTLAIKDAISYLETTEKRGTLFFPSGEYIVTDTLNFNYSAFTIDGGGSKGNLDNNKKSGAQITLKANGINDGIALIKINTPDSMTYGVFVNNIRLGTKGQFSEKPIGMHIQDVSEGTFNNLAINGGFSKGIKYHGGTLLTFNYLYIAANDIGFSIELDSENNVRSITNDVIINSGNFWINKTSIKVTGELSNLAINDSWFEYTQKLLWVKQEDLSKSFNAGGITFNSVRLSNGSAYQDTPINGTRAFVFEAGASNNFVTMPYPKFNDCSFFTSNSTSMFDIITNSNTSSTTTVSNAHFNNCRFTGVTDTLINTDGGGSNTFLFTGSFFNQNDTPLTNADNLVRVLFSCIHNRAFGYLDMSKGYPIRLPNQTPITPTVDGQMYFKDSALRVTSDGSFKVIPYRAIAHANSSATDIETLRQDFNSLLSKLRTANIINT